MKRNFRANKTLTTELFKYTAFIQINSAQNSVLLVREFLITLEMRIFSLYSIKVIIYNDLIYIHNQHRSSRGTFKVTWMTTSLSHHIAWQFCNGMHTERLHNYCVTTFNVWCNATTWSLCNSDVKYYVMLYNLAYIA